jgi:hypothetical protein
LKVAIFMGGDCTSRAAERGKGMIVGGRDGAPIGAGEHLHKKAPRGTLADAGQGALYKCGEARERRSFRLLQLK